ncbi:hypothetical protein MMC25_001039 [Agyrium rufum]|nr:hypothetical protein [Agyrium rufum]
MSTEREYELVILGATGYTGQYCAEHITTSLPTDLKWAVAGRSASKLSSLVSDVKKLNPDRAQPGVEVATLSPSDLNALAKKTTLLINTVGPYHLYSTPVVEACVNQGTHYLDVTGETPWVKDIIEKFHDRAKENKAIIIPEIGFESTPSDLLALSLVSIIEQRLNVGTKEVIASLHNFNAGASGGTLATVLSIFEAYSLPAIVAAAKPWALSPISPKPSKSIASHTWQSRLLGTRTVPHLGLLTNAITASTNAAIVQRTWGLLTSHSPSKSYGPTFQYREYMRTQSQLLGTLSHYGLLIGPLFLLFPPSRWLLKKLVTQPGSGPTRESTAKNHVQYRAIGIADCEPERIALAKLGFSGSMYDLTGRFLAQAAMCIVRDGKGEEIQRNFGGGVLTPAILGETFTERMRSVGMNLDVELLET